MTFVTDPEFWARCLGIVLIDLTLAGDNALVIALAVRALPNRQKIQGQIWGSIGGVGLRLVAITSVAFLLKVPLLQFIGGVLLLWIAVRLVARKNDAKDQVRPGATLLEAIRVIIVADLVMSLDNVLAIAALAAGNYLLVVIGISLSLPLVVWGSGILAGLLARHAWAIWIGVGILGYAAGEIILRDPIVHGWLGDGTAKLVHYPLSFGIGAILMILGWVFSRRALC